MTEPVPPKLALAVFRGDAMTMQTLKTIDHVRQRQHYPAKPSLSPDILEAAVAQLAHLLRGILDADERGQGLPYAEAMDRARAALPGRL